MQNKKEQLSQLQSQLSDIAKRKAELIELKANKKAWTKELQEELDDLAATEVDLKDKVETMAAELGVKAATVPEGSEHLIHLLISKGRRFSPITGKDETLPYLQTFTLSEFRLFKDNAKLLGYHVLKVIHDPTGQAASLIEK